MKRHALIWTWVMFGLSMIAGFFFLMVGVVDLGNIDQLIHQLPEFNRNDVIAACTMFIVIGGITVLGSAIVAPLSARFIKVATTKKPLIVLGVLSIIFNGVVPGILMLCIKQRELDEDPLY